MDSWYNKSVDEVVEKLNSNLEGLTKKEREKRLIRDGKNEIAHKKKDSIAVLFFKQLLDPIVLLLIVTVIFSLLIGEIFDAVTITFIILVDLIIGTIQENQAEKTALSLSNMLKIDARVLIDKKEEVIKAEELVKGDIVLFESGDKVSADTRIIDAHNIQVDESSLTGESTSVVKSSEVIKKEVGLSNRNNMLYAGCVILTGRAKGIVVETGLKTELGIISDKVVNTKETPSPLTIRMKKFSKQISILILVIALIISVVLYLKGTPANDIFLSVIALAVSAMPEGLPLAVTMALSIASNRMAKKKVIVKKLNSVESLGSTTIIASDKTGTLTLNQQTAKKIVFPNGEISEIDGVGYNNEGLIKTNDIDKVKHLALLGVINNEAELKKVNKKFTTRGDSIDLAFLALGLKAKVDVKKIKKLGIIPYESENKYSGVFYQENNKKYCTVKGSLEVVLKFCSEMEFNDKLVKVDKNEILKQHEELAENGYRIIALASREITSFEEKENYDEKDVPKLVFRGLVAFIDPVRREARKSIDDCHKAGIKVVMITGDHPLTAFAIAKDLGLVKNIEEVATDEDFKKLEKASKKEFQDFIKTKTIFTRVTPTDKLRIVEAYKDLGEFVAVTGDGVNDAPAIKSANIGIAMGSGTDTARETASMIILDDNFKSIVTGIKEGRSAYSNIRKITYLLLSCGLAEVLFFLLSIIFNLPLPLIAIQLLWLNIVTDGLQDLALSFEKTDNDVMKKKPIDTKETLFNKGLRKEVILSGVSIGLLVFFLWVYLLKSGFDVKVARSYIVMFMVFIQNMHVLNCRSEDKSFYKVSLKSNPFVIFSIVGAIVLQIIFGEVKVLSNFLSTTPIPILHLVLLFILSTSILWIVELYKYFNRKVSN